MHRPQQSSRQAILVTSFSFYPRLALGEMADLVLNGQQVIPQKLLNAGYKFQNPTAEQALQEILKSGH